MLAAKPSVTGSGPNVTIGIVALALCAARIASVPNAMIASGRERIRSWAKPGIAVASPTRSSMTRLVPSWKPSFASSGTMVFRVISADAAVGSKSPSR
jgi:hypothetical protein